MINFDGMSYKMIVDVFWEVINDFCPNNITTFKNMNVVYSKINEERYRIMKYLYAHEKHGIRFSIVPNNEKSRIFESQIYDLVEDDNNFIKSKQNPPIINPSEFINKIIANLGIEKIVYKKLNELKDARTLILML